MLREANMGGGAINDTEKWNKGSHRPPWARGREEWCRHFLSSRPFLTVFGKSLESGEVAMLPAWRRHRLGRSRIAPASSIMPLPTYQFTAHRVA